MLAVLHLRGKFVVNLLRSRRRLEVENLFLRHQLNIALRRAPHRLWRATALIDLAELGQLSRDLTWGALILFRRPQPLRLAHQLEVDLGAPLPALAIAGVTAFAFASLLGPPQMTSYDAGIGQTLAWITSGR